MEAFLGKRWNQFFGFVFSLSCLLGPTSSSADAPADSSASRYQNRAAGGGPASPGGQLASDDEERKSYFRIPVKRSKPWFDWKREINEKYGLQFGLTYQAAFFSASDGITDESETSASSGVLGIPVSWTPWGRESGKTGTFTLLLEDRHGYGSSGVTPMFLGFQTGSAILPATKFNDVSFRPIVLHYGQMLLKDKLAILVGKIAPDDYFNFHGLIHPFKNFMGYANSVSPSVNWPNPGLGGGFGYQISKNLYMKAAVTDVQGDHYVEGEFFDFGDRLFDGKIFSVAEIGWVASYERRYFDRAGVTFWHSDAYEGSEVGHGVAFAANWLFSQHYMPFFLAGVSNGKGANTLAEGTVTGGFGYQFESHDVAGISLNWARPPGVGLRDQYTVEGYYRFYLTERLAVTPDIQWVLDPSLNPAVDSLLYYGLRLRIDI